MVKAPGSIRSTAAHAQEQTGCSTAVEAGAKSPDRTTLRTALSFALAVLIVCGGAGGVSHAQTALPTGFGSLTLGMHWDDVQHSGNDFVELTRITSEWERLVYECGYRRIQLNTGDARLLVTTEDFQITQLSYVTPIDKGSNLLQVAQLVINSYGQPRQATMRDSLGAITIDQSSANYVTLDFTDSSHAKFVISGDPLWEYRISIEDANARRAQNRTIRCARAREKQQQDKPPKKNS